MDKSLSKVGFEFEFLTELSNNDLVLKLEKLLGKKIVVTNEYHSEFKPSDKVFKLEPDFSMGSGGRELVTGPLLYEEAKVVLEKVLNFIRKYGHTTKRSAFQPNISFEKELVESLQHTFNPLKFIMEFDEEYIYERFPERRNNLYAKSIKKFTPLDSNFVVSESGFNSRVITYPKTKYYGVNFEKLVNDYLEVRYIGGENYEFKFQEISEVWDYALESIYNAANPQTNQLTTEQKKEIENILDDSRKLINNLSSAKNLQETYQDIKFRVDLEPNSKVIDNKLYLIRDKMFSLFSENDLGKGVINYDSEKGRFQLKGFKLENADLKCVDLLECELTNTLVSENSELHKCKIKSCDISDSKLFKNKIVSSRVANCFVERKNEATDTYVKGRRGFWNGHLKSGIFREGYIMPQAKISDVVDVVDFKKF